MQEATAAGDGERIAELGKAIHACEQDIEARFARLEALTEQRDRQARHFDRQLQRLEEHQRG